MDAEKILVIAGNVLGKSEDQIKRTPYINIIEELVKVIENE